MTAPITTTAWLYNQTDADPSLDVPGEGYTGWQRHTIDLSSQHTALVVMHAWAFGGGPHPGVYRAVEYKVRSEPIARDVLPPLIEAVRAAPLRVYHVTSSHDYATQHPNYGLPRQPAEKVDGDPCYDALRKLRGDCAFPGRANNADINAAFKHVDFPPGVEPHGDEPVCDNADALLAACKRDGVNHLIYTGFAINWCLLMSPGGMVDMARHGLLCSTIREATTAVENRESARTEAHKEEALWRIAMHFGFVFDLDAFVAALPDE